MQASEDTSSLVRRRSARRRIPNINGQEALTLAEAAQLRAQMMRGVCQSAHNYSAQVLIQRQMIPVAWLWMIPTPLPQNPRQEIPHRILYTQGQPIPIPLPSFHPHHQTQKILQMRAPAILLRSPTVDFQHQQCRRLPFFPIFSLTVERQES
jgi:hypothetical protein